MMEKQAEIEEANLEELLLVQELSDTFRAVIGVSVKNSDDGYEADVAQLKYDILRTALTLMDHFDTLSDMSDEVSKDISDIFNRKQSYENIVLEEQKNSLRHAVTALYKIMTAALSDDENGVIIGRDSQKFLRHSFKQCLNSVVRTADIFKINIEKKPLTPQPRVG